jgi:hypothetical protein
MRQTTVRLAVALLAALVTFALVSSTAFAQSGLKPKANPTAADIEAAKKHMAAGVAFMRDPDSPRYEEAYPEFRKAYELSGSLNALHNLAISSMKLELDGEAIEYYERVLKEKGDELDPADKQQIESDLTRLKATVAWVTLSSDSPGVTVIDERVPRSGASIRNKYVIGLTQTKLGIHPGTHKFTATTSDGKSQTWSIEITNGASHNHEFVFDKDAPVTAEGFTENDKIGGGTTTSPDETSSGGTPAYVWAMVGVTGAAAITWAALMGVSASKKADYDDNILGEAPMREQQAAFDDIQTFNLVTDVMLGVTVAAAATTLILALTAPSGDEETGRADGPRLGVDYHLAPIVAPNGTAVGAMVSTNF